VFSLTGINYQNLRTAAAASPSSADGGVDQQIIAQFADAWVGDYVAKLSSFVDYFNVQFPSHEGDDTAVLSLRQDLLGPIPQCTQLAPNLLLDSGRLDAQSSTLAPIAASGLPTGWWVAPCDPSAAKCLTVLDGAVLPTPDGPQGAHQTPSTPGAFADNGTGVTWLSDVTQTAGSGMSTSGPGSVSAPPGLVIQAVSLDAGNYILSWWDQARAADGTLPTTAPAVQYVVRVFDASWREVAEFQNLPYYTATSATPPWSQRQTLQFSAAKPATFYVSFGASTADEQPGSVAIADVQLEQATGSNLPSTYVETQGSRMVAAYNCQPMDSDLRAAFDHSCDSSGRCFYDLKTPVIIDTQALNDGTSPLVGKLAQGNYNFRHVNLAVNLVGTGVRDCTSTPTPDCFGTGYVEYTLEHDGTSAGILDYNGATRIFNFGVADIQHGKALAAERYITMPVGMDDQNLLSQPGIQHIELRGRPLDGVYRLRVWDSPALKWDKLQDIQVILNYRYWSEIVSNNGTGQGQ
jgi:hypothetical protein